MFYVPNGLEKILNPGQTGKIVESTIVIFSSGVIILLGTGAFLYNKTVMVGTIILSLYMTNVTIVHLNKGKPIEGAMLIVIATILAFFIRKTHSFTKSHSVD